MNDLREFVEQAGGFQRELPVVVVDIEHAALRARFGGNVGLVDDGGNAVDVQHASEHEPAEARANDCDGSHGVSIWGSGIAAVFAVEQRSTISLERCSRSVKMWPWRKRPREHRRVVTLRCHRNGSSVRQSNFSMNRARKA